MVDPAIQDAHAARVPYLEPELLGDHRGRCIRLPSPASLAESYATQEHIALEDEHRRVVRADLEVAPRVDVAFDVSANWIISAWNPAGKPCTFRENESAHRALHGHIADAGAELATPVTTTAPDRSWLEDAWIVTGIKEATAIAIALLHGQPAITAVTPHQLTIVPTGLTQDIRRASWPRVDEARPLTCPMRVDDKVGARCTMRGGPWVSASIHAASIWNTHRRLLLPRLGCQSCQDGQSPAPGPLGSTGGIIDLGQHLLASRYGGYVWPSNDAPPT